MAEAKKSDKVVLVTGGGRGIGKKIAETLGKEGYTVVICSRTKSELEKTKNEISSAGGKCEYFVADVTNSKDVEKLVEDIVASHKRIDVVINNAGWCHKEKPLQNLTDEDYKKSFDANVGSVFYFARKAIPVMLRQTNGMIINISSGAAKLGRPKLSAYAASKAAVHSFTTTLGKELEGTGVSFITLSLLGGFNTPMRAEVFGKEDASGKKDPQVVADFIKDLLSGKAKAKNGDIIDIS